MTFVFGNVIPVVLPPVVYPFCVILVKLTLLIRRQSSLVATHWIRVAAAGDLFVGDVGWNVVPGHDLLHFADVFRNVVPVVLAGIVYPFRVLLVEFLLIVGGKPA